MPRTIVEPEAYTARQHAAQDVQVAAPPVTSRTAPVDLPAAARALLPLDRDQHLDAIDDDAGLPAREGREGGAGYLPTARTFAKGKKWRPGGNKPYQEVLLALSKIPDSVVSFEKVLTIVPERRKPGIKGIRSRITEVIYDPTKDSDLRKQVAFDPESGFSIEDPLFRYFLTNLEPKRLFQALGVEDATVEKGRLYSYDIGFSFAGETRKIVEEVNEEMKTEDVVTFYDYDQQAFLLALDLEETLGRVYAESCRYYLVFLDKYYREKVWTKYEKDLMTARGRKGHIIPVLLDDVGAQGAVGIPTTIGRIDLRDVWTDIQKNNAVTTDATNTIRNRCVLPILVKLDAASDAV